MRLISPSGQPRPACQIRHLRDRPGIAFVTQQLTANINAARTIILQAYREA